MYILCYCKIILHAMLILCCWHPCLCELSQHERWQYIIKSIHAFAAEPENIVGSWSNSQYYSSNYFETITV